MDIATPILQTIDLIVNQRISSLSFDKTIQAKIVSCEDSGVGKYKLSYQDSYIYAYSNDVKKSYVNGTQVYVKIPNNDFGSDSKQILGTVKKLGTDYIQLVDPIDKFTVVGNNIINTSQTFGLKSYGGSQVIDITQQLGINATGALTYAQESLNLFLGASFQTKLTDQQKVGNGHYGISLECQYYKDEKHDQSQVIDKIYVLDVDNMVGQPYNFVVPSRNLQSLIQTEKTLRKLIE